MGESAVRKGDPPGRPYVRQALWTLLCASLLAGVFALQGDDGFQPVSRTLEKDRSGRAQDLSQGWSSPAWTGDRHVFWNETRQAAMPLGDLPRDTYALTLEAMSINKAATRVSVRMNGRRIGSIELPDDRRWYQVILTLPAAHFQEGRNVLLFEHSSEATPVAYSRFRLRNYFGYSKGLLTGYLVHRDTRRNLSWSGTAQTTLQMLLWGVGLWGGILALARVLGREGFYARMLARGWAMYLPGIGLLALAEGALWLTPYRLVTSLNTIWVIAGASAACVAFSALVTRQSIKRGWLWLRAKDRQAYIPVILMSVTYVAVVAIYASHHFGGNLTGFAVMGDTFQASHIWRPGDLIQRGSHGYDGQFYFYIAHDPFLRGSDFSHIDIPAYRYGRIGYPLLVYLASLGQPAAMPLMMIVVNVLAVAAGVGVAAALLRHLGWNPGWSVLYGLIPGLLLATLRDLTEPVALAFLLGGIYGYLRRSHGWAALCFTAAVLTRETAVVAWALVAAWTLWQEGPRRAWPYVLAPVAYLLWQGVIYAQIGSFSLLGGHRDFGWPFLGMFQLVVQTLTWETDIRGTPYMLAAAIMVLAAFASAIVAVWRNRTALSLAFLGYAILAVCLNERVWVEPWAYLRVSSELMALLLVNMWIGNSLPARAAVASMGVVFAWQLSWLGLDRML